MYRPFAHGPDGDAKADADWTSGDELRYRLLEEAAQFFVQAQQKDREYLPAFINQAGVADLMDEPEEALWRAGKALKMARRQNAPVGLAHAHIISGLAHLHTDPPDSAAAHTAFTAAAQHAPTLAQPLERVSALYGEATYLIATPRGTCHAYPRDGLTIQTDAQSRVQEWMLYYFVD